VSFTPDPPPSARARPTGVRHLVLAALLAVAAVNYVQRNSIGAAETTVRADLALTMQQTGDAIAAFFLTYALFQVPSGWLAQRWGAKRALVLFTAGWSVAVGLTAFARGLPGLLAGRLALGALQAGVFPCATLILAVWYPASRRGVATALLNSFMLIGGALGSALTGLLLGPLGWRWLFALYAVPGLLWALWFALWFRSRPEDHPGVNDAELAVIADNPVGQVFNLSHPERQVENLPHEKARAPIPWGVILLNISLLMVYAQQFCRAGASRFFDTWLPTYLQEGRGESVEAAGVLASLPQWLAVVGGVVGGALSDWVLVRTGSRRAARKGVAVGSLLAGTLCYLAAYYSADVRVANGLLSLGYFLVTFASPCAYALTMDMGGRHLGIVFGVMNMAGNLGAMAFTWVFPRLKAWSGGWDAPLALFAALNLIAAAAWLLADPDLVVGESRNHRVTENTEKDKQRE
jgi:MFS family permease